MTFETKPMSHTCVCFVVHCIQL